ncbi:MAG: hypothetical protein AAB873_01470, partial [Patescibacteria group bacterium]
HELSHCQRYKNEPNTYQKDSGDTYPNNKVEAFAFLQQFKYLKEQGKTREEITEMLVGKNGDYGETDMPFFNKLLDEVFKAGRVGRYGTHTVPFYHPVLKINTTGPADIAHAWTHYAELEKIYPTVKINPATVGEVTAVKNLNALTQSFVSTKISTKRFLQSMPGGKDQTRIGRTMVYDTTTKEFATFTPKIDGSVQIHTHFVPDNPDDYVFNLVDGQIKVFNYIEIK